MYQTIDLVIAFLLGVMACAAITNIVAKIMLFKYEREEREDEPAKGEKPQ